MYFFSSSSSSSSSSSTARFLSDEDSDEEMLEKITNTVLPARNISQWRVVLRNVLIHAGLLTIYTAIVFSFWPKAGTENLPEAYSPALPAVQWELRTFENSLETANPFKGPPSPELDKAWDNLLEPSAIRLSKEDLDRINRTSVRLLDGSGYFGTLDVHHQLHCLRWVREALNPEYYGNNTREKNKGQHIDHCLDSLRQFVMCKADVGILTYDWMPQFHRPWPNFEIQHKCAKWDPIQAWAESHSFHGFDERLIKHPNFHPELASPFSYAVSGNDIHANS